MELQLRIEAHHFVSHPWGAVIEEVYTVSLISPQAHLSSLLTLCSRLESTDPRWGLAWEASQSEVLLPIEEVPEAGEVRVKFVVGRADYEAFKADVRQAAALLRAQEPGEEG